MNEPCNTEMEDTALRLKHRRRFWIWLVLVLVASYLNHKVGFWYSLSGLIDAILTYHERYYGDSGELR